jgi:hypothetical protein
MLNRVCAPALLCSLLVGCRDVPAVATASEGTVPRAPIDGAWLVVQEDANTSVQPSMMVHVDGHYAVLLVHGPRPILPEHPTAEEMLEVWGTGFSAQSGTYELFGDTVVQRPLVAKNPAIPERAKFGRVNRFTYRVVADTLWMWMLESTARAFDPPATYKMIRMR